MVTGFASHFTTVGKNAETDDWECVYDLCSTCRLTYWQVNLTAYWSQTKRVTIFGNSWEGVPDMPSKREPTERQVTGWVLQHHNANSYLRHLAAATARRVAWEQQMADSDLYFRKHGLNYAVVAWDFASPKLAMVCAGKQGPLEFLRNYISPSIKNSGLIRLFVGKLTAASMEMDRIRWASVKRGRGINVLAHFQSGQYLDEDALVAYSSPVRNVLQYPRLPKIDLDKLLVIPSDLDAEVDKYMDLYVKCENNSVNHLRLVLMPLLIQMLESPLLERLAEYDWTTEEGNRLWSWWNAGFDYKPEDIKVKGSFGSLTHKDISTLVLEIAIKKLRQYRPNWKEFQDFPIG